MTYGDPNYVESFEENIGITVILTDIFQINSNITHLTRHFLDSVNITVFPIFSSKVSMKFGSPYVIKFL